MTALEQDQLASDRLMLAEQAANASVAMAKSLEIIAAAEVRKAEAEAAARHANAHITLTRNSSGFIQKLEVSERGCTRVSEVRVNRDQSGNIESLDLQRISG